MFVDIHHFCSWVYASPTPIKNVIALVIIVVKELPAYCSASYNLLALCSRVSFDWVSWVTSFWFSFLRFLIWSSYSLRTESSSSFWLFFNLSSSSIFNFNLLASALKLFLSPSNLYACIALSKSLSLSVCSLASNWSSFFLSLRASSDLQVSCSSLSSLSWASNFFLSVSRTVYFAYSSLY